MINNDEIVQIKLGQIALEKEFAFYTLEKDEGTFTRLIEMFKKLGRYFKEKVLSGINYINKKIEAIKKIPKGLFKKKGNATKLTKETVEKSKKRVGEAALALGDISEKLETYKKQQEENAVTLDEIEKTMAVIAKDVTYLNPTYPKVTKRYLNALYAAKNGGLPSGKAVSIKGFSAILEKEFGISNYISNVVIDYQATLMTTFFNVIKQAIDKPPQLTPADTAFSRTKETFTNKLFDRDLNKKYAKKLSEDKDYAIKAFVGGDVVQQVSLKSTLDSNGLPFLKLEKSNIDGLDTEIKVYNTPQDEVDLLCEKLDEVHFKYQIDMSDLDKTIKKHLEFREVLIKKIEATSNELLLKCVVRACTELDKAFLSATNICQEMINYQRFILKVWYGVFEANGKLYNDGIDLLIRDLTNKKGNKDDEK